LSLRAEGVAISFFPPLEGYLGAALAPFLGKDYNHAEVWRHWLAMAWLNGEITKGQLKCLEGDKEEEHV